MNWDLLVRSRHQKPSRCCFRYLKLLTGIKENVQKSHICHQLKVRWDLTWCLMNPIYTVCHHCSTPTLECDLQIKVFTDKLLVRAQLYENLLNWPMKPFHLLLRLLCALSGIIPASSRILSPALWSMTGHFISTAVFLNTSLIRWHSAFLFPYGQDLTSNAAWNAFILCSFDALRTKGISFTSKSHKNWVQNLILWFFFLHFRGFNIFM